jgi:[acyl-carrier-protein] S-malonyltransferase
LSKTAFLFPGQGAQAIGMGKSFYDELPIAVQMFEQASDILGYDLADVCFNGPADRLNMTEVSQPALYVTSMVALEKLKAESPEIVENCAGAAGLSLGEYTAIAFAGGMSFEDGLKLVQLRGQAMQAAADETAGSMVSVLGLDRDVVQSVCDDARVDGEVLQIANLLCKGNIVVSGGVKSCEAVEAIATEAGAMKCIALSVAGAFHTSMMESAVEKLTKALADTEMSETKIPVYSNVDAAVHQQPDEFRSLLVQQVCSPVLWQDSMEKMLADGYEEFYEVGSGRVLRGLMKRINRKVPCHGVGE